MLQELQRGDPRSIGPYRLVGQLGSGGMGRVFLGRSAGGRPVAVKVIRADLAADPDFRARFRREVAAARRVSGLFTAMVVDADVDAAEPWLATAYVAGPQLAETVRDHGPLPVDSLLALAAALAESLAAIHAAGVVHRDLKPSNVLLAEDGPRVIDFGISRAAESTSVTRAGFVIGSPGFMSPEQAEGGEIGPPSDIFSLGAVLAFAATGEGPFGSGSTAALVYRIVFGAPRLDNVPEEIRPLIGRCLAKDPAQRPSAGELLTEIGAMQPETGWLPEPVIGAFPGIPAQAVTEPPPSSPPPPAPEAAGALGPPATPHDTSTTITGFAPFIAAEPEVVTPGAGTVPPGAGTVPPEAGTVPPEAGTIPPEAGTVPPGAGTAPPEPRAATPGAGTVVPEPETGPTRQAPASGPGSGPEPPTGPEPARGPQAEPEPPPLPWGDLQGPRRPRLRRPLVLGAAAAAVILIASGGVALALSGGSGHPSAAHSAKPATVTLPTSAAAATVQSPTAQPSPTPAPTSHRPSARPTPHPVTRQSTQAPPTTRAPAPATSSAAPRPKPTTPKPTHAPPPATYGFSASGATEASCGDVGAVQSSAGTPGVNFNIANNSSGTVQLDEIGTDGSLQYVATLSPHSDFSPPANVGTYLVLEKSSGACLAVFHVTGSGQVTVT